jgi:beta-lactam-binding protein with PASTA domain
MPDLTGWPVVSAQAALAKVGINTAPPSFVDEPVPPVGSGNAPLKLPVRPGEVLSQSPTAGSRVDQDTTVKLTVAK